MGGEHTLFAPVPLGLESLLAEELRALGALRVRAGRAGVAFAGTLETAYRVCLWSRVASRVLLSVAAVPAPDPEVLYQNILQVGWEDHVSADGTLAVDVVASRSPISHTGYATLKVKDAIVDRLRDRFGVRPSIDTTAPDVRVNVALRGTKAVVSIDLAGEGLHRRGYRTPGEQGVASLKENLAAGVLLLAGWPEIAASGGGFCDPLCGSGTLVLEAALMSGDIAPGLLRERWGFEHWLGHDARTWEKLVAEAGERREAGRARMPVLLGTDADRRAVGLARASAGRAGLSGAVRFDVRDVCVAAPPRSAAAGLVATNPPYGERLGSGEDLRELYAALGKRLREAFGGWNACIVTGAVDLLATTGLAYDSQHATYNGRIPVTVAVARAARPLSLEDPTKEGVSPTTGAASLANRVRKNMRHLGRWARGAGVTCYRIYDADLPEYAVAVDVYEGAGPDEHKRAVHIAEYAPPASIDPAVAQRRLHEAVATITDLLEVDPRDVYLKVRKRQRGKTQYARQSEVQRRMIVAEGGLLFEVNLSQYLDTGLFLDHRPTRALLRELAESKRFLNLFGYTGTATVYAAAGGASSTTTVDLSATYLDWCGRNMALNGFSGRQHTRERADVLEWLESASSRACLYDLIFCDPPTFSRSKRMSSTFDVQRDHVELISRILPLLADDGVLIFSNNLRTFRMQADALEGVGVKNITAQTVPADFARNPKIHNTWQIEKERRGGAAAAASAVPTSANILPEHTVRRSSRARRIRLTVTPREGLVVTLPRNTPASEVSRALTDHAAWAERALADVAERRGVFQAGPEAWLPTFVELPVLGRVLPVTYEQPTPHDAGPVRRVMARERDGALHVTGAHSAEEALGALRRWRDRTAHRELPALLAELAHRTEARHPARVTVRGQRTRWGSCSARGTISLNRNLIFLPGHLVTYVLAHELAHLDVGDHSPRFWDRLGALVPAPLSARAELRDARGFVPVWADE